MSDIIILFFLMFVYILIVKVITSFL